MDDTDSAPRDRSAEATDVVEFYWRPGCMYCAMLRRGLRRRGIPIDEHNIWDEPEAAQFVRSVAGGNETVPTVVVAGHWMVNPSAGQVESLLAQHAPEVLQHGSDQDSSGGGFFSRLFSDG
ncbi:MAG: glutaredoxin domain-containing protein [Microthrixaceae bacterium]